MLLDPIETVAATGDFSVFETREFADASETMYPYLGDACETMPRVTVMLKTAPTAWTRCPGAAKARLSLPSHSGWRVGSAIKSKIRSGVAATSRGQLQTTTIVAPVTASGRRLWRRGSSLSGKPFRGLLRQR